MALKKQPKRLDVIIVHGQSLDLVDDLKEFLSSLDLKADYGIALPPGGKPQFEKVRDAIRSSKIAVVLATFDEANPSSKQARPNVYDELTECHRVLKRNVLVLVEKKGDVSIELPSNLKGHLIELPFERTSFHRLYPLLVKELRERGMIFSARGADAPTKVIQARSLNNFLDNMDKLWDNEFDEAWKLIRRGDYEAENEFANRLDVFFNLYWDFIDGLIRKKLPPDEIAALANTKYNEALRLTADVWQVTAKASLSYADALKRREDSKPKSKLSLFRKFYDAADADRRAAQKSRSPYEQIDGFKRAIVNAKQFVDGIENQTGA
jgi:hypothetical protein